MHFILHWWLNFFSIIDRLQFKSALRQSSRSLWYILGWWKSGNWGLWYFSICWFLILFIQVYRRYILYRAHYKTFHDNVCWGSNWGDDNHSGSFSGQYDLRGRDDSLSTASTLNAFNNITSRRDDPRNFYLTNTHSDISKYTQENVWSQEVMFLSQLLQMLQLLSAMFLVADGFWDGKQYRWACQVDEYGNISHTFTIIRLDI